MAQQKKKHKKGKAVDNKRDAAKQKNPPGNIPMPFFRFIVKDRSNLRFLLASAVIPFIYFVLLRTLFPVASYDGDSMTYVEAAVHHLEVGYRPIGYSNFINFFYSFSQSDGLLIFAQYIFNIIANLFLFFTLLYFFSLKKVYRVLLFILLIGNPLYVLYSNCIISDPFFCSLSVAWFTTLLWVIYRPRWLYFFIQLVLLYWLFHMRYNALIYPFIAAVAYLLSKQAAWKKIISISITCLLIFEIVTAITNKTEDITGTATFSAFGGWQLANNALLVMKHVKIDSSEFNSETSKQISVFANYYFDSIDVKRVYRADDALLMWNNMGPLKRYMYSYIRKGYVKHLNSKTGSYFSAWNAMGTVFDEFGAEVIKKYPFDYFRYFVLPNIKQYAHPPLEVYDAYNGNNDSLPTLVTNFYHYPSNKIDQSHAGIMKAFMRPWSWIFTLINILFLLLAAAYYFMRGYKKDALFNKCLIFYLFFFASNFSFSVLVAPIVFRYQITILTLCIAFIICLWQRTVASFRLNDNR